jgi:hypothetical protein
MKGLMDFFQMLVGNVSIYLGCSDALVAEHFLNGAKVSAAD